MQCPKHAERAVHAKGGCKSCYDKDLKARNSDYAQRQRDNHQDWVGRPGNRQRANGNNSRYQRSYGSRAHRKYGISREEYNAYLREPCGICGAESKHLDHNHETGEIRGGLCHRCNLGLGYYEGWFQENKASIIAWLRKK